MTSFAPLLAAIFDGPVAPVVIGMVVLFFLAILVWASRYTKVGPNEVLIVSGRRQTVTGGDGRTSKVGFRIVRGGGTFVMPVVERVDILSLELMTIDVKTPEVYTIQGVPIMVDGVAQVKVGDLSQLASGDVFTLDALLGDPVELRINGVTIAQGELVSMGDRFAVRIGELVGGR